MTRIPKLLVIVTVVAAALLAAGCTTAENPAPTTTPTPAGTQAGTITVLDEEMNESTVAVKLNSRFALELAENPSTGYSWNLTLTEGLRVASDEYVPAATNATVVGAGGHHRWEIVTAATGLQEISGVYVRPWENATVEAADRFMAEISVTP